jgi:hypothetical protein
LIGSGKNIDRTLVYVNLINKNNEFLTAISDSNEHSFTMKQHFSYTNFKMQKKIKFSAKKMIEASVYSFSVIPIPYIEL